MLEDARTPRMEVWGIIWTYFGLCSLIFCFCGFTVRLDEGVNRCAFGMIGGLACAALCRSRLFPKLSAGLGGINQYALICLGSVMLIYAAATTHQPLYDNAMLRFDEDVGYRWQVYSHVVAKHRLAFIVLSLCYGSIAWQPVAISMSASVTRQHRRLDIYMLATMFSLMMTALIFALFPVTTAWTFLNLQPADLGAVLPVRSSGWVKHLLDLRAGQDMAVSLREDASLVGFPSFHMEAAVLGVWFFWRDRVLRWPAILLNAAMAAAAPLFGGHYVADLVAGTLVALLSVHLAAALLMIISDQKKPARLECCDSDRDRSSPFTAARSDTCMIPRHDTAAYNHVV